jgi:hypothetical protein
MVRKALRVRIHLVKLLGWKMINRLITTHMLNLLSRRKQLLWHKMRLLQKRQRQLVEKMMMTTKILIE